MYFPFPITIKVHRKTLDKYGDPSITETFEVTGCARVSRSGASMERTSWEVNEFRQDQNERMRILAPAGTQIDPTDQIELPDGRKWEVDGPPSHPYSPFTGWQPGVRIQLRRVTG